MMYNFKILVNTLILIIDENSLKNNINEIIGVLNLLIKFIPLKFKDLLINDFL